MRVAITGHTSGIGKELYKILQHHMDKVFGCSIANGYDITNYKSREKILEEIKNFDIFVNNAFDKNGQTKLLKDVIDLWKDTDKLIVNISSKSIYIKDPKDLNVITSNGLTFHDYQKEKLEQQKIIEKRYLSSKPNIFNCILGPVDCGFSNLLDCKKLDPRQVANIIAWCILNKDVMHVQQIILDVPGQSWEQIKIK